MSIKIEQRVDGVDRRIEALLRSQEEFREEFSKLLKAMAVKADKRQKEADKRQKEADKRQKEADKRQKEIDEQLKRTDQELRAMFEKTDKEIDKVSKEVGKVSDGLGRFAEGLVAPSVSKLFFFPLGIKITQIFPRVQAIENKEVKAEMDLLCSGSRNGKRVCFVGEVKARLSSDYVRDFIDRLTKFKEFFPDYKEAEVIGFVAGMTVEDNAKKYAERKGLYVLAPEEDMVKILNKQGFKPKNW
ncbi:MAG: hypothetical protein AB1595_03760 [bacterium]